MHNRENDFGVKKKISGNILFPLSHGACLTETAEKRAFSQKAITNGKAGTFSSLPGLCSPIQNIECHMYMGMPGYLIKHVFSSKNE